MIRDYMMIIVADIFFVFLSLTVSFTYNLTIHQITGMFDSSALLSAGDLASLQSHYTTLYAISNIIQIIGIISIIGGIITSALIVSRMRYSPFGIPLAVVFYFVGIFIAMIFSNSYVYLRNSFISFDPTFIVNSYMDWLAIYLPYIAGVMGAVLMVLAYAKAPLPANTGGGLSPV